ncbi:MAG: 7-cyano-7-deazaguanine synthase QueC [Acidobacteria bacterium]|nr:7-cyano-7-deazaguanine synthase QueC [Acidobacteriota bacterium]
MKTKEASPVAPTLQETSAPATEPSELRLEKRRNAVVLLSGGLDSATTLAVALAEGYECYALTVAYGQRHDVEIDRARSVALFFGVPHQTIEVDLAMFGGSALTSEDEEVPHHAEHEIGDSVPTTYVPARNTVLLSLALACAEPLDARHLFLGANVLDYSGYPDCRPEFLAAFEKVANLGTKAGSDGGHPIRVHAPLLRSTKSDIIRRGAELGVPFQLTHSCYDPTQNGLACGLCDACILRRKGFQEAGVDDPTSYAG